MRYFNGFGLLRWALLPLVLVAMVTATSRAGTIYNMGEVVSLAALLDDGEIVAGDKRFSNFVYTPTGGAPAPADVSVAGFYDNAQMGYGPQFSGDFSAGPFRGPSMDAGLGFTVDALDPRYVISDVHLNGTLAVFGNGSVSIVESIVGIPVKTMSIRKVVVDGQEGPSNASDWIIFEEDEQQGRIGFRRIRVLKDINAAVPIDSQFDEASVTSFTQVFTQRIVPEPSSFVLLGMALVGMAAFLRRRG